jgi:histidinol-phosphate aminotransferase
MGTWEQYVRKVEPYVPGEQPREQVIKLNTNENPYPPSPAVDRVLSHADAGQLRLYPDPEARDLVEAIAAEKQISPDQVFVGVGSDDVLAMSFLTFFGSDQPILFPDITYSFYDVWANLFRIPFVRQPLRQDFSVCGEDYKIANGGIVLPNPNAPTGLAAPVELLEDIIASNPGSVVIIDEAYVDFGGESVLPLIHRYDNLLVVQTFSKSRSLAGSRIGYAMGNARLIACLNDCKYSFNSYTMDRLTIAIGKASMEDEKYFRQTVGRIIETREWTKERLRELGFHFPDSSANFIFAAHEKAEGKALFEALKQEKIYVRHFDKDRIRNYLRITIGTREEMETLLTTLKRLLQQY